MIVLAVHALTAHAMVGVVVATHPLESTHLTHALVPDPDRCTAMLLVFVSLITRFLAILAKQRVNQYAQIQ